MSDDHSVDEERSGGIQVISRAAKILNALGKNPQGMSLGAIANEVQLPRSTVQRIVAALAEEGLVRSEGMAGVRLGPTLLRLVSTVHTDVIAIASPYLKQLSDTINETVALGRTSGIKIANIYNVVAERELRVSPRVGLNLPIYGTSAGRALLALKSDEEIHSLLGDSFEPATENTVRDIKSLLAKVARVRETGVSTETGETVEGISTMAVSLDTLLGRYAVSIILPTARLGSKEDEMREALLNCKAALLSEIGK